MDQVQPAKYFLVEVADIGNPVVTAYDDIGPVVAKITKLEGKPVSCYVFVGWRATMTKKPRYLCMPDGRKLKLFGDDTPGEEDESGYLGSPDVDFTPPPAPEETDRDYDVPAQDKPKIYEVGFADVESDVLETDPG